MDGKKEFYAKAENDIRSFLNRESYDIYYPEHDLTGRSKPDGFAVNSRSGNGVVVEIKSPKEPPTTSCWRQVQPSDTPGFIRVRLDISQKESSGELDRNTGGHIIIIEGQLEYYKEIIKQGKVRFPEDTPPLASLKTAYVMPNDQRESVIAALEKTGRRYKHYSGSCSEVFLID